jgi:hypothetical protein
MRTSCGVPTAAAAANARGRHKGGSDDDAAYDATIDVQPVARNNIDIDHPTHIPTHGAARRDGSPCETHSRSTQQRAARTHHSLHRSPTPR